jgi:hypothetical protein
MSRDHRYQFVGPVDTTGKLDPDVRGHVSDYLRTFAGKVLEISVRQYRKQRSIDQNAWIWGVAYPLIAESIGYDRDEHEELHYWLVRECFGTHHDKRLGADVANVRSSKLTTAEFSEYMEWLVRFSAKKFGVVVPLPSEAEMVAKAQRRAS